MAMALTATLLPLTACGSPDGDSANSGATAASTPSASSTEPEASDEPRDAEPLPFNASGLLGGNAKPTFADGEAGEVAVVQVGPLDTDQGILIFAFRNNTSDGISHVDERNGSQRRCHRLDR
jgi:hypothetical protein